MAPSRRSSGPFLGPRACNRRCTMLDRGCEYTVVPVGQVASTKLQQAQGCSYGRPQKGARTEVIE